jgi:hypothetical protein
VPAVLVVGCHSLEKREFREGESDRLDERECRGDFCDLGMEEEEEMKSAELGTELKPVSVDI